MRNWIEILRSLLQQPLKIGVMTLLVVGGLLLLDGTLYRIWALNRDSQQLEDRISELKSRATDHERQLKAVQSPLFIEKLARDRLDLVREGDLIFIFSGSEATLTPGRRIETAEPASR